MHTCFSQLSRWVFGLAVLFLLNSCGINSAGDPPPQKPSLTIQTKPAEAGQVDSTSNQWHATASPGYIFQYWELTKADGTLMAITTDTTTINPDSVESVVAVFDKPSLKYGQLVAGPSGRHAYFTVDIKLPSGARQYAVVQADLKNRTKQKIVLADKPIVRMDVSHDLRYIAFASVTEGMIATQIYDLETQRVIDTISGGMSLHWANRANKLLISSENHLCMYTLGSRCRPVPLPPTDNPNVEGLTAAAWSPDDKHLVLARDFVSLNIYDTQSWQYEKVTTNQNHVYFDWLDERSFLTNGTYQEGGQDMGSSVLRYAVNALSKAPENFSINTDQQAVSSAPGGDRLAYIHEGLNIYENSSGRTNSLFSDQEYSPAYVRWVQNDIILFYDESKQMVFTVDGAGNVTRL